MTPRSLPNSKLHSPYFSDTHEALSFLSKIAKDRNWLILFKPHPLAEFPADLASRIGAPEFVQAVPGASIFECLEVAQVTTTIVSQVSYMSLIQDKPCVMMGRNYLSGKECTYEPQSQDEIAPAIDRAFAEGFTARQRENWSRHVAQLLRYSVFGFDKDFSAPGLRPNSSAAEYLVSQCRDTNFDAKKTSLLEDIESSRTTALMLKLIERTATGMRFRRY